MGSQRVRHDCVTFTFLYAFLSLSIFFTYSFFLPVCLSIHPSISKQPTSMDRRDFHKSTDLNSSLTFLCKAETIHILLASGFPCSRSLPTSFCPGSIVTGFLMAQKVKNPPAMQETQVPSLGWEEPLEEGMANPPVFLPGESHGQRSLVGFSPWGRKESEHACTLHSWDSPRLPGTWLFCHTNIWSSPLAGRGTSSCQVENLKGFI